MWLCLALSYFLLCRASELFAHANGLVHPDFCLTRDCPTFFRGDVQVTSRTEHVRTLSRFCLWRRKKNRIEKVVRPPACAWRKGRGLAGHRSELSKHWWGSSTYTHDFPEAPDDETCGVWVESDNSDRSSRRVENDGSKRWEELRLVCVALGADRGSYQASRAGNVRVANPAGRSVEVSDVYGLCERCGRKRTKGVHGPYKGRVSRWR